jgi:hypothetical protein
MVKSQMPPNKGMQASALRRRLMPSVGRQEALSVGLRPIPLKNSITSRDSRFVRGTSEEKPTDEVQRFATVRGKLSGFRACAGC